jgi:hypothetical protein
MSAGKDAKDAKGAKKSASEEPVTTATLYPFGNSMYNLQLEIARPAPTEGKAGHSKLKKSGVHVIFVLDNSGSMGGDFQHVVIPIVVCAVCCLLFVQVSVFDS